MGGVNKKKTGKGKSGKGGDKTKRPPPPPKEVCTYALLGRIATIRWLPLASPLCVNPACTPRQTPLHPFNVVARPRTYAQAL